MNAVMIDKNTPVNLQWFTTEDAVFICLSAMIQDGWIVSTPHSGLVYNNLVARPIKVVGDKKFTGVGLWNL